ncbi:MAG: DUF680 domain-containing protein [Mesorhizobium sp.]|uniref:DUF680 domain-containing protein n=1 Tax=Mesorhizobium sp. TaxID=1871066 RepID=UPI000FEA872F|nr:DUF680 domain-containing protein [Mesorhizobium sp.]RWM14628.1 MAG: DUF680 domain-containing protein [Mesorhizobium sp.]TIP70693.1 MAG: DUF680 domain-containing protein [Mesorhizobium sp.]TIQ08683.1 MAG: DUF680 domain-containing protein [Mesorhizobium sp.]TIR49201.1 MAG: DUF680 domain-containing protein [Mesorhizobium sp.]TJV94958.1 MAG: DUF680 domain-containing protein [Mesorhizobium sp.]
MKKTIIALVAVLAFSGAAFAGQSQPGKQAAACADTNNIKLDCGATGSVEKTGTATHKGSTENKDPRLGIDIDPWIVPSTF